MANYKYKLSEMSKKGTPKQAEEEFDSPYETLKVGKVSFSDDGTSKSTVTNIDPETGAVSWEITQLPGFDKLYDELDDLVSTAKRTYVKTKDDKKFREFYDEIRQIRNKVRTHLRNDYPDQYKRITRIGESKLNEMIDLVHVMEPDGSLYGTGQVVGVEKDKTIVRFDGETVKRFPSDRVVPVQEEEVDEISLSGAAGSYLTPYAFRKKGQKPNDIVYKELGFKPVMETFKVGQKVTYLGNPGEITKVDKDIRDRVYYNVLYDKGTGKTKASNIYNKDGEIKAIKEGDTYEKMAAKGKKAGNLKQGTVRKRLNIPKGEKIPLSKIKKEISRIKKMENPSEKNKKYLKALNLAKTLKTTTNINEDKDPGATLGPGPKAGPDGVDDNYYVKAFKYKLVPKKNGTYVQKGSGLEVKKLF